MSDLAKWADVIAQMTKYPSEERGFKAMAVKTKGKPGRKPGSKVKTTAYSIAGLVEVLNNGDNAARIDAVKRYPATSLALLTDPNSVLGALTGVSARQAEAGLRGEVSSNGNAPEAVAEISDEPKRGPGRPKKSAEPASKAKKKAAPVVSDEDDDEEEDDEEEAPVKRGPGRPKGSATKVKAKPAAKKKSKRAADEDDDDDDEINSLLGSAEDDEDEEDDSDEDDEDSDEEEDDEEEDDEDEEEEEEPAPARKKRRA